MKNKKKILFLLLMILSFNSFVFAEEAKMISFDNEKARVLDVEEGEKIGDISGIIERVQKLKLEILTGEYKGEIVDVDNPLSDNYAYNIEVKKGDKVLIGIEIFEDEMADIYITSFLRQNQLFLLLGIFILLIILIGGKKGLKSIFTLFLTILLVLKVFLPLLLKGVNPIPISIGISIIITICTIFIISGINAKSLAAVIGTSSGVIVAGLIAYIVGSKIKLTGLSAEEATALMQFHEKLDFSNLLFSGIILGALGAIMDVGMSIASAIEEVYSANNGLTRRELFKSGMNVGKDIMGTMTNTLILAYTGSSIPLLLLFMSYEPSLMKILNLDIIATEIVRSLSGSIGLVLTIPLTAFIATVLINKNKDDKEVDKK